MSSPVFLPVRQTLDTLARPLTDLRISVTDRCNFRCRYCMPREAFGPGFKFMERPMLLSFEEITRLAGVFRELGVRKLRLTGGEPLLRRELPLLVEQLSQFECDLSLTTNGSLLGEHALGLRAAGLKRITVSVDSLEAETFERITDANYQLPQVLEGVAAAERAGFEVIKINMVVRRGLNDHEVVSVAKHFSERGHIVRFIEFMDVGQTNGWLPSDVVPAGEIVKTLEQAFTLEPLEANYPGEVARRYRISGTNHELGVIASVSQPFCGGCTRARLSAEGKLYTCLFASSGTDLREPLRAGADDQALKELVTKVWHARGDRYSELRHTQEPRRRIEMSYIGG